MSQLFEPLTLPRGKAMPHRIALAPLTNGQSHADGTLSDAEYHWLTLRAKGGFALTMTCAAHVQACGQGFPGQLGIFSDDHLPGLTRLASGITEYDSRAVVQLHHAGMRAPAELIGKAPVCPSDNEEFGAVAMTADEVNAAIEDFVTAAERAERAGFDGVELHGAHGYLIGQFLSPEVNQRTDQYGGSAENRARMLWQIIDGIRERCGDQFQLGLRLSAERFGIKFDETIALVKALFASQKLDYIDLSLWDVFKRPHGQDSGPTMLEQFAALPRHGTRIGAAGKVRSAEEAEKCLALGADFVFLGRAAIVDHDFPAQLQANPDFQPTAMPAPVSHLEKQGVTPPFMTYLEQFGLVQKEETITE